MPSHSMVKICPRFMPFVLASCVSVEHKQTIWEEPTQAHKYSAIMTAATHSKGEHSERRENKVFSRGPVSPHSLLVFFKCSALELSLRPSSSGTTQDFFFHFVIDNTLGQERFLHDSSKFACSASFPTVAF